MTPPAASVCLIGVRAYAGDPAQINSIGSGHETRFFTNRA